MGNRTKTSKSAKANAKTAAKPAKSKTIITKNKKNKNIFKVAESKKWKKPKEIQGRLRNIQQVVKKEQESVDNKLKNLHQDLVVKKPKSKRNIPIKAGRSSTSTNINAISANLDSLKC